MQNYQHCSIAHAYSIKNDSQENYMEWHLMKSHHNQISNVVPICSSAGLVHFKFLGKVQYFLWRKRLFKELILSKARATVLNVLSA